MKKKKPVTKTTIKAIPINLVLSLFFQHLSSFWKSLQGKPDHWLQVIPIMRNKTLPFFVLMLLGCSLSLGAQTVTTVSGSSNFVNIPDNNTNGATAQVSFNGIPTDAVLSNIEVTLGINHQNVGDLIIKLIAPTGDEITLVDRPERNDFGDYENANLVSTHPISFSDAYVSNPELMGTVPPLDSNGDICKDDGNCTFLPNDDTANRKTFADLIAAVNANGGVNGNWQVNISDNSGGNAGNFLISDLSLTYTLYDACTSTNPISQLEGTTEHTNHLESNLTRLGNSFVPDCNGQIESLRVFTGDLVQIGSDLLFTIDVQVHLYKDPFGTPVLLESSDIISIDRNSTGETLDILFDTPHEMIGGQTYAFQIENLNGDNYRVEMLFAINTNLYPAGEVVIGENFETSNVLSDWDMKFEVNYLDYTCTIDTDNDGVVDCNDQEANSPCPNDVNANGVSNDSNNNGTPDCQEIQILYVDADAAAGGNGTEWSKAFTYLQDALAFARIYPYNTIEEIWVAEGTYYPDDAESANVVAGSREESFYLVNNISILGGFNGTEATSNQRAPEIHKAILSGDIGTQPWNGSYHVVRSESTIDESVILDGFTITKGYADGNDENKFGGGIYNSGSPTYSNLIIDDNHAISGAGVYSTSSQSNFNNIIISNNNAGYIGGGMYNTSSNITITNSSLINNLAGSIGGGMFNTNSSPIITNVTFARNQAGGGLNGDEGGAICNYDSSSPTITNASFFNNWASKATSIFNQSNASPVIVNSVFHETRLPDIDREADGPIVGGSPSFKNCYFNFLEEKLPEGSINVGSNLFDQPNPFTNVQNNNFQLIDGSPAIDAGDNNANTTTEDAAGNPRRYNDLGVEDTGAGSAPIIDMGAYEKQTDSEACANDSDNDGVCNEDDQCPGLDDSVAYDPGTITFGDGSTDRAVCLGIGNTFSVIQASPPTLPAQTRVVIYDEENSDWIFTSGSFLGAETLVDGFFPNPGTYTLYSLTSANNVDANDQGELVGCYFLSETSITLTLYGDTDNDGVCDSEDICEGGDDSADADGDSVPDACDVCDGIDDNIGTGQSTKTWTGAVNDNWANPCNWRPIGVPTSSDEVEISNTHGQNVHIYAGTDAEASSLALLNNVTFTVKNGASLSLNQYLRVSTNSGHSIGHTQVLQNHGTINIGQNLNSPYFNSAFRVTGDELFSTITNFESGIINIDNCRQGISLQADESGLCTFNNEGEINIGQNGGASSITDRALHLDRGSNAFKNSGKIYLWDNLSLPNANTFENKLPFFNNGLLYVNTAQNSSNLGKLENDGVVVAVQGGFDGIVNKDLLISPIAGNCQIEDAIQIGNSNDYTVLNEWFYDGELTNKAGDYDQANNTFSLTQFESTVSTLYMTANNGSTTYNVSIEVTLDDVADVDLDGVVDCFDQELASPCPNDVDVDGVSNDEDGDGMANCVDVCPIVNTDEDGGAIGIEVNPGETTASALYCIGAAALANINIVFTQAADPINSAFFITDANGNIITTQSAATFDFSSYSPGLYLISYVIWNDGTLIDVANLGDIVGCYAISNQVSLEVQDLDEDGDGVLDCEDQELNSPCPADVDANGVSNDDDGDGIANCVDQELDSPCPTDVDANGVSNDDDGDGTPNCTDDCDDTVDTDNDSVVDCLDICPTIAGDLDGGEFGFQDNAGVITQSTNICLGSPASPTITYAELTAPTDGLNGIVFITTTSGELINSQVSNVLDFSAYPAGGYLVTYVSYADGVDIDVANINDLAGCYVLSPQNFIFIQDIDEDGDGIQDCVDQELNSPCPDDVDENGVSNDDDNDGIINCEDTCPSINGDINAGVLSLATGTGAVVTSYSTCLGSQDAAAIDVEFETNPTPGVDGIYVITDNLGNVIASQVDATFDFSFYPLGGYRIYYLTSDDDASFTVANLNELSGCFAYSNHVLVIVQDKDEDGDGVQDCDDQELNSSCPTDVDANGVSNDDDGDGIANCVDDCDDTVDADSDGVVDCVDQELGSPCPEDVDANGVSNDDDGDGIANCDDICDDTIDTNNNGTPDCQEIQILYVDTDAVAGGNGTAWSKAFTYLQDALTFARTYPYNTIDEIWVAEGIYYPDDAEFADVVQGSRTESFSLINGISVYGGFTGNEVTFNERNIENNLTILSGNIASNDNDSYHVVLTTSPIDATAVLDGFTITGGHACCTGNADEVGGGIYNAGSATYRNLIVSNNEAGLGGGVYNVNSQSTFDRVTFKNNKWFESGGGMYNQASTITITNSYFIDHIGSSFGGFFGAGIDNLNSSVTIINTAFINNSVGSNGFAPSAGGAIYNTNSSLELINSNFYNNAAEQGLSVFNSNGSTAVVTNAIVYETRGSNATRFEGQSFTFNSNYFNLAESELPAGSTISAGNLFEQGNPFVDAGNNNFQLIDNSPAVDAGDNAAYNNSTSVNLDLAGNTRIVDDFGVNSTGLIIDMGAYEKQTNSPCGNDTDGDGVCDEIDQELGSPCPDDVDENGVSNDEDGDGIADCVDDCDDTIDADNDGVADCVDQELNSPCPEDVDANGVSNDEDGDGTPNCADDCDDTIDADNDGVADCVDQELNSPCPADVDADGVSNDEDGDGIANCEDNCNDAIDPGAITWADGSTNLITCPAQVTIIESATPDLPANTALLYRKENTGTYILESSSYIGIALNSDDVLGTSNSVTLWYITMGDDFSMSDTQLFGCYQLSDPITLVLDTDSDGDGLCDNEDAEPNSTCPDDVDANGVSNDLDADGIPNCEDACPGIDDALLPLHPGAITFNDGSTTLYTCQGEELTFSIIGSEAPTLPEATTVVFINPDAGIFGNLTLGEELQSNTTLAGTYTIWYVTAGDNFNINGNGEFEGCYYLSDPITLTVEEQCNQAPVALCQDITVYVGDDCQATLTAAQLDGGSSDPDGDELIFSVNEQGPFAVGEHILTVTVSDGSLSSTCTATLTVEDNTAPTISCQDVTIQLDDNGLASVTATTISNGSNDACGLANLSLDKANFDCTNIGDNVLTLTATDLNGNSNACQATVTVVDDTKPDLTCPEDLIVNTDPGECGAYVTLPKAAPTDNCGIKNLKSRYRTLDEQGNPVDNWSGWADDHSGFFEPGVYEIQWRAKDDANNKGFCSYHLNVIDKEAPEVICTDVTINFNDEATIAIEASTIFDAAASFDACGPVTVASQSISELSCRQVGETLTVQVVGVDPNGNTAACTAQVTVVGMPCGFEAIDIDCPAGAEATYDPVAESFTLTANDCEGYPDGEFSTVMTELCGDGEIIAKVVSLIGDGRAGVIMMESDEPGTRFVSKIKDLTPRPRTEYRTTTGGSISNKRKTRLGVEWVRIVRQGNKFKTYTSTNGSYWRLSHIINFSNFADCIQVGMLVYSKNANEPVTAVFENVEVTGDTPSALEQGPLRVISELQGIDAQQIQTDLDAGLGLNVAPNPFAIETQIEFTLPKASDVTLEIYNLHGQRVRSLENAQLDAGTHRYEWDGTSNKGGSLPTGMYMLRLRADKKWITTKVSLVNR